MASEIPERVWLRDRHGDRFDEWTWAESRDEVYAAAAWLETRYGSDRSNIALLSRNRAHWFLADLSICASGNVSIPMFTTLTRGTAQYVLEFTETNTSPK